MNYFLLNAFFLAAALIVFLVSIVRRPVREPNGTSAHNPVRTSVHWAALGITLVVLLVTTMIFDNLIIGSGIVAYHVETLSGVYIGVVPIEDLSYSVAAVLLLPALWRLTSGRKGTQSGAAREK